MTYIHNFFFFIFIVDTITGVSVSRHPLPTSTQPLAPPSGHHHTALCVYEFCTSVLYFPLVSCRCVKILGFTLDLMYVLDYTGLVSIYNSSMCTTMNEVEKDVFGEGGGRGGGGYGGDEW